MNGDYWIKFVIIFMALSAIVGMAFLIGVYVPTILEYLAGFWGTKTSIIAIITAFITILSLTIAAQD